MTTGVLEREIAPEEVAELAGVSRDIPCDWRRKDLSPCPNPAKYRVRVWCDECDAKGTVWCCEEHFEWLKKGKAGCVICKRPVSGWELL